MKKLLFGLFVFSAGCGSHGPAITVCVLDAKLDQLECVTPDGKSLIVPISGADKYLCMPSSDLDKLVTYCKERK